MKKRLEADLISIAHRILQLKNRSEINQLYLETQKLYEKLAVMRFVDEHFGEAKPTIGQAEIVEKMKQFFEDNNASDFKINKKEDVLVDDVIENEEALAVSFEYDLNIESLIPPEKVVSEEIIEESSEEIVMEDTFFTPSFDLVEEVEAEIQIKSEVVQISFDDLLEGNFDESMFVKVNQIENIPTAIAIETSIISELDEEIQDSISSDSKEYEEPTTVILNEKIAKGITIDLNDRIGFVKHLFGNDTEDYNRVLNQLITFDNFEETQNFIEDMVKPDYNNWEGKEDYAQRFMEIIERKFAIQKEIK